jgi:hypothetical protein
VKGRGGCKRNGSEGEGRERGGDGEEREKGKRWGRRRINIHTDSMPASILRSCSRWSSNMCCSCSPIFVINSTASKSDASKEREDKGGGLHNAAHTR